MCRRILAITALLTATGAFAQQPAELPLDALLNTRISSAAKYEQQMSEAAASVTIVMAEEFERYGWTTLDEALQSVRGLYLSNDRTFGSLGVRGLSRPSDNNDRILVLLNGHSMIDNVFGSTPAGASIGIDLGSIERIEIVRGPGSAIHGTAAMFAVINIVTRGADAIDGFGGNVQARSNGERQGSIRFGRTFANETMVAASAFLQDTNGEDLYFPEYDTPATNNGVAEALDFNTIRTFNATLKHRNLTLMAYSRRTNTGIPTAAYGTVFNADSAIRSGFDFLDLKWKKPIGTGKELEVRAYWNRYSYAGDWPYEDVTGYDWSKGVTFGTEGRYVWDASPRQRVTLGTEIIHNSRAEYFWEYGPLATFKRPYTQTSVYLQHEFHPVKQLSLITGIRSDHFSHAQGATNPRAALIYRPNDETAVKVLYGRAFRLPGLYELEFYDPLSYLKGNPDLEPETVQTLEVVLERRLSRELFLVASAYDIRIDDLIEQELDPADGFLQYRNLGSATGRGVELELDLRRSAGLWAFASYSLQDAREQGNRMSNSPEHLVKAGVSSPPWSRLHGGFDVAWESGRRTLAGTMTDSSILLNGVVSFAIGKHVRLIGTVRNALDAAVATPAGPEILMPAIMQDGRTFALKLSFTN